LNHPVVLLLIAPALLAAPYVGWNLAFAYISGWRRAARLYRAQDPFVGDWFTELYIGMSCASRWWSMRGAEYGDELKIGANRKGLHLSAPLHPPLFIPWSEMSIREETAKAPILWTGPPTFRIGFRGVPGVELVNVSVALTDRLKAVAGDAWPRTEGSK
jgi:hypothetical protein